jgi:hypothetical protein
VDRDFLSTIPGALLSSALHSLPNAATSEKDTLRLVVDLPDGQRAQVTFARLKRRKYRCQSGPLWYWTAASAVLIEK